MIILLLCLVAVNLVLCLMAIHVVNKLEERITRQHERERSAFIQMLGDLSDKIAVMKGYREYAPIQEPPKDYPEEFDEEEQARIEEGFYPYT